MNYLHTYVLYDSDDVYEEDADIIYNNDKTATVSQQQSQFIQPSYAARKHLFSYFITTTLIVVFGYEMYAASWEFEHYSVNTFIGPDYSTLLDTGARYSSYIISGDIYRLFTGFFLSKGLLQLIPNCMILRSFTYKAEMEIGVIKSMLIFIISGFIGSVFAAIFVPEAVGTGAQSAIYGYFGIYSLFLHTFLGYLTNIFVFHQQQ